MRPFIEEARYAAEHRNHYWRVLRGVSGADAEVNEAAVPGPYPSKGQKFNDEARKDQGKNFGRVARGGLMTDFIDTLLQQPVSGIPARHWQSFLRIFAEGVEGDVIERKLKNMREEVEKAGLSPDGLEAFEQIQEGLRKLLAIT